MKPSNIGIMVLLLALPACSVFYSTPPSVLNGQRGVYQGVIKAEENNDTILMQYEKDCKAAVTYHSNFVFQTKLEQLMQNGATTEAIALLESERDEEILQAHAAIDTMVVGMRKKSTQNLLVTKKLVESVYNYMSSTPIEVDNVDFWLERLREVSKW